MIDEDAIRRRAYAIWLQAGSPPGLATEHWDQARRELEAGLQPDEVVHTPTEAEDVR